MQLFCSYMLHRQFYEVTKLLLGKISRIVGVFMALTVFSGSFVVQVL